MEHSKHIVISEWFLRNLSDLNGYKILVFKFFLKQISLCIVCT